MRLSTPLRILVHYRVLDMTVKPNGFKTEVDDSVFDLPKDFKKVPLEEIKKILTAPK